MNSPFLILVLAFSLFVLLNVPIAVSIALATFLTCLMVMGSVEIVAGTIAQQIATAIDSFSLLAIPFFILSGLLMGRGGMARRLMDLAQTLVGHFPGGLAYVNVLTCMLFGAVSGSATAAVSAIGGFMIPAMSDKGYSREFSTALTLTAATTGLLIPPSNIMIVYALVSGGSVSIAALFIAGILPGVVFGLALMAASGMITRGRGFAAGSKASFREAWNAFRRAILSLLLIAVVLGGILNGVFTATEAAAIAVLYSFILAVLVYREVSFRELPKLFLECGVTTGVVFLLIGTSVAMSWILSLEEIPAKVSSVMLSWSANKYVLLILINVLLLLVGMFMDMTPAVLIFTPIFWPVVEKLGLDPLHFGIIIIANLCIGLCTPPVGTCLFVGCSVGKTTLARVTPSLIPFILALIVSLLLITYVPQVSLFLPRLLGL